jgi:glycine C-acetyltransferase
LWTIVEALQTGLREAGFNIGNTESPVTPVLLNGTIPEATNITVEMREKYNIFCSIVTYPVVPKGVIMLRLIPTAQHTLEDVRYTIEAFKEINAKLLNGEYANIAFADISKL